MSLTAVVDRKPIRQRGPASKFVRANAAPAAGLPLLTSVVYPAHLRQDPEAVRSRFEKLRARLNEGSANLVVSKRLNAEVLPFLLQMEKLLSPSTVRDRAVLEQAGLPGWPAFLRDYSTHVGYSLPDIRNLLRESKGLVRISPRMRSIDRLCEELLDRLLQVLEFYGEKIPILVTDVCRSVNGVLSGTLGIRAWRKRQEALDHFRV